MKKNEFNFFVPLNDIEKGKDKSGNKILKIAGIASTDDTDSDEENLEVSGFDVKPFLEKGFLNYNHRSKDNPAAIIGEPTKAEVRGKKLYIEGELYSDSKTARQVYDLAKILQKSKRGRRLGMSIEGKVLERDSVNQKRITKAVITGCAITPVPKNPHTLAEIIKGEGVGEPHEFEIVKSEKQADGGMVEYILDITDENGNRITVDKDFNTTIVKKSISTAEGSGKALARESVDGGVKKINEHLKKNKQKFL